MFLSSGDLIADRRYQHAQDFLTRGDLGAAADLFAQAAERAPRFASAWFALGDVRERLGDQAGAIEAFERARAADPEDRSGAGLRLARLDAGDAGSAMTPGYVRAVFDQYAPGFDRALVEGLAYRGPQLLFDAVMAACASQNRPPHFDRALDLGCGTGLVGEIFSPHIHSLVGVDLSPQMIEVARRKGCYDHFHVADLLAFLRAESPDTTDLVIAADALVYVADLVPVCVEVARVLELGGLFAFTLETYDGDGVVLGDKLRYQHGVGHVRAALAAARLLPIEMISASTRTESGIPVPGLLAIVQRSP